MANHPEGANNYVLSRTWDEAMAAADASGVAEAAMLPVMVAATQPETAELGGAAYNGGGDPDNPKRRRRKE